MNAVSSYVKIGKIDILFNPSTESMTENVGDLSAQWRRALDLELLLEGGESS